jgi:hypothetical protein
VLAVAWIRRDGKLLVQGLISAALLFAYLAYQLIFVRDIAHPQRFRPAWFTDDSLQALTLFGEQLWQGGRGILGLRYHDFELVHDVLGTGILKGPLVVGIGALLIASVCVLCFKEWPRTVRDRRPALVISGVAVLSLAIYGLLWLSQNGILAIRYAASFFLLAPFGFICAISAVLPVRLVRFTAGVLAAVAVAFSVGLLIRAEVLVSRPNRDMLAQLQPGTAIVLEHAGWAKTANGQIGNGYPGLVPIYRTGLANPFRSAWTAGLALRLYSNVMLGTSCRRLDDGSFAVSYNGGDEVVFQANKVIALGLPNDNAMETQSLRPVDVCPRRPALPSQPGHVG